MEIGGKIRFLLLLLGICCILTALSLNNSITQKDLLEHEAKDLQANLHAKEKLVENYLTSSTKLEELKRFSRDAKLAQKFIDQYRAAGVNLLVYRNNQIDFWSALRGFPPNIGRFKEGSSFIQLPTGWYELIKKTSGDYTMVFLITVKLQYSIENQYLKKGIAKELFARNSLDVATFTDKEIVDVVSIHKEYLFPVKLSPAKIKNVYVTVKLWLWLIGLFSICLFVNSYCFWLVRRGFAVSATLIISLFFIAVRLSDLQFFWFNHQFNLDVFSPFIYAQGELLPSLGDLLLHTVAVLWVVIFIYINRHEYQFPTWIEKSKAAGIAIYVLFLLCLAGIAFGVDEIFNGLILNSKINFDITNIINLDWISWIGIFILCIIWLNIYLGIYIFIALTKRLNLSLKERLVIFLAMLGLYGLYQLVFDDLTVFFLVYGLLVLAIGWNYYIRHNRFSVGIFSLIFLSMSFLTALKYLRYNDLKERTNREDIVQKLLDSDDPKVITAIDSFEDSISSDSLVVAYFKTPDKIKPYTFHNYISKKYLDGYLSRFDNRMYEYNRLDFPLKSEESVKLDRYKELIKSGASKLNDVSYSYKINDTFGAQNYFSVVPIFENQVLLGTLIIELKSQPYDYSSRFPDVLIDGKLKSDEDFSEYSLAFYKSNNLLNQSGPYTYPMFNKGNGGFKFNGINGKVIFESEVLGDVSYSHAVYQPDPTKLIIITREKIPFVVRLATLSFFFLVFIIFGIGVNTVIWISKNLEDNKVGWFNINRYLMINVNKILYKTRIQLSIVLSVVATLIIIGWTTFYYIRYDYRKQQQNSIREKVRKIQLSFEKQILNTGTIRTDDEAEFKFMQFADVNAAFLNLYDTKGNLLLTSLDKMYDHGILARKMGAKAYIQLHLMQRSEYVNTEEKIGDFKYAAAYAPIRNAQNRTIAYIGLPYYASDADYEDKIGLFINTLINIYALVFVMIGILAVFLANQITNPLTFIQESIRKTKLGQKNQPIVWHRQDEIGSLIKEYNKMLAALELSATKLAQSERENAWREMAKQVAHEIKNPLTPLKLGVQLLEKSWKENDPNFEKKFASFNKSFIEQIDSLATIASEFSSFAKMPDTKLEPLELLHFIDQALPVFNTSDRVEIVVLNRTNREIKVMGDKDQLIRIFNNLLKNAIEASEDRAKCAIQIRVINDHQQVFVEIQDNGKGIDADLHTNIFTPNFTTKSSGTGLGLAFVKQAMENAGGTVSFTSEVDKGTTFFLTFPLSSPNS